MKPLFVFFVLIVSFNLVVCSFFKNSRKSLTPFQNKCRRTGCFNQYCSIASIISHSCPETPQPEDLCKEFAICTQLLNGKCGWGETKAYQDCLQDIGK